ncbi:MAG: FAD-dependent monooxygenase [Mycobacterium sp.]
MNLNQDSRLVVVVGAGPVGQVAALALAGHGLPVLVLEADTADRERPGSRAIYLFRDTLRRLDRIEPGLGRAVAKRGIQIRGARCTYDGRTVFGAPMPRLDPLVAPGASLPQRETEALVHRACQNRGVQFRWGSQLTTLATSADGVELTLDDGEIIRAAYVVGADGARSVVREQIGRRLEGPRDTTPFIIVDVDAKPDGSTERTPGEFHYRHPRIGGRNVMHMPFAGGMRIDLQCLPDDDVEHWTSPAGLREWIEPVLGPWYADHVNWQSTYTFHQAVADSFTDGHNRVLLVGEAAHLFAPWGGRGLNSGVMDATDTARAIATADRAAIQRCADDRRKWALHNRDVSSSALRQMRADDPVMRITRASAAAVSPWFVPAGYWLMSGPAKPPWFPWPWRTQLY